MMEICCGVVSETESNPTCKPSSRAARRRRMEIRRFKFVSGGGLAHPHGGESASGRKRKRLVDAAERSSFEEEKRVGQLGDGRLERKAASIRDDSLSLIKVKAMTTALCRTLSCPAALELPNKYPKFGVSSVCGRRREMEDMIAVHPSFCRRRGEAATELHYFGVYDGHGCSHVAVRCRERMHQLIKEELVVANEERGGGSSVPAEWKAAMERSFLKMDKEVMAWNEGMVAVHERCRCELQLPECEAVGSTAVVAIVTPDKIVVANCGDSRAVLSRKGKAIALSSDHKPDRPDELNRIQEAGGRVIYWDGPRVLGVLAMSRAIGDNYLKPYVSCDPEVTVVERTADDDCLILASDGLWDVVSNDTACGVARMCLMGKIHAPRADAAAAEPTPAGMGGERPDRACSDASLLLTKLALARHSTDNVSVVVVDLRGGSC